MKIHVYVTVTTIKSYVRIMNKLIRVNVLELSEIGASIGNTYTAILSSKSIFTKV